MEDYLKNAVLISESKSPALNLGNVVEKRIKIEKPIHTSQEIRIPLS